MDTIENKMSLKKRFLAFFASMAVLAGGVVAGVQADTAETGTVQIDVVDVNGAPVAGAKLQIVDANDSVRADFESNGQTQEFTLEAGSYTLHELVAPEGYEVAPDVSFEVVASQTVHTQIQQNAPPASENAGDNAPAEDNNAQPETRSAPETKAQSTRSDVYVDGKNGNDDNDGSKDAPVATWAKAKELLASEGTIYVAGTLQVSGDISTNNPGKQVVKRAPGFTKGNMFNVTDSAKFTNIHIKGNGETVGNSVIAFEHKGKGNSLVVGQGVTIENFVSTGEGAAVYVSDAAGASVTFDGAKFLKNQALNGGAVAIRTAAGNGNAKGFTVNITGGTVFDGNVAKKTDAGTGQGGAVFLNGQFVTNIDNATFKNNVAQYGAAIVNYNHEIGNEINIVNGLVTGNKTGSGTPNYYLLGRSGLSAGGVNICMAGAAEVNISSENGVAIFDNSGPKGDIAVWDNSDVSKLKVNEGAMLGGGNHNWTSQTAKGYKANPTAADKAKARASATVIFEGNTSDYHGAVMSNGIVQFGTKLAELRIRKVDAATGKVMGGVVFKLTSEKGNVRKATTFVEEGGNAEYQGVASFTDLPDGKYTLEEVTPAGYRGTMPWNVTIQNQQVTIQDNGQKLVESVQGKYYNFVIRNQPITVKISKQELGDNTKELPGAQIKVTGPNGFVEEWTSGNAPHEFAVKAGNYTLTEVSAPAGFEKITTIIKFSVNEKGEVTVTNAKEITGGKVTVKDVNHLVLEDKPLPPSVTTDAKDAADGDKYVAPTGKARVIDVVTYTNLRPGKEYTVTGTLHKKVDGKDAGVLTVNGKAVTATKTFTADKANGTVELTFEFDASALAGETLVAFESVTHNNVEVAAHTDINDEAQTVRVVKIRTFATDAATEAHIGMAATKTTLKDVVAYTGLKPGATYTVKGKLVKRADGTDIPGATAETTFTASETGTGFATVTFKYDATALAGFASVAYEYLYDADGKFVTKHEDIKDENQTVYYPKVTTSATDKEDGDKVLDPEKVTVVDTVTYTNLVPNKEYTVSGELHIKKADGTDGGVLKVNGKAVTASKTFTPTAKNGEVKLEFTFDASALNNQKLVVFEEVKYNNVTVAVHADINDTAQTVEVSETPSIGTYAKDGADGDKLIEKAAGQKIVDTVKYSNLNTKKTYRVVGVLMDKETGQPVLINGKQVTAQSADFKPADKDGEVEVTFTVDGNAVAGKDLVVFEKLYTIRGGVVDENPTAIHEDIDDDKQTVHVKDTPGIEKYVNQTVHSEIDLSEVFTYDVLAYVTKDADKVVITDTLNDDLQFVSTVGDVTVVDLGEVVDHKPYGSVAQAGIPVENAVATINGQKLTVTIEPAEAYRGHWVKVTFDAKIKDGKKVSDLKFAKIEKNDPVLTDEVHEGVPNKASYTIEVDNKGLYEDESNTVTVKPTKIGTYAAGSTGKIVFAEDGVAITDTVAYEGLEAGETYTLKGTLVKKSDGSVIAAGEAKFEAVEGGKGMTQMIFTVNASELAGDATVAYEYLFRGDVVGKDVNEKSEEFVTKHEDINDADQTVEVVKPEVTTNASDKGDGDKILAPEEQVTVVDVVTYKNLIVGKEYTVTGTLHIKNADGTDGGVLKVDGKEVTASKKFTAEQADGSLELEFTFNASVLNGKTLVAFEEVKYEDKVVAAHTDINDTNQTVYFPEVGTVATTECDETSESDGSDESDECNKVITIHYTESKTVTITDTIKYSGLVPGEVYTVKGQLVAKTDEQPVIAENAGVFQASETGAGEWTLDFTFEANRQVLDGIAELVVFEYVFDGDVTAEDIDLSKAEENETFVAKHEDINDENQTIRVRVTYPTPELIGTVATDDADGDKVLALNSDVTVKDVVEFEGLAIGRTYTLKAKLVVKGTGGKEIVAEAEKLFVPEVENGTTDMFFTFNTAGLEGESLVAYEYLFVGDVYGQDVDLESTPLKHADDNDANQTVTVEKEKTPPPPPERPRVKLPITGLPKTGESVALAGMVALMLLGGGLVVVRRRNG